MSAQAEKFWFLPVEGRYDGKLTPVIAVFPEKLMPSTPEPTTVTRAGRLIEAKEGQLATTKKRLTVASADKFNAVKAAALIWMP